MWRHQQIINIKAASHSSSAGKAYATLWKRAEPEADFEQRLAALEQNLTYARSDLTKFQKAVDQEITRLDKNLKEEQDARNDENRQIKLLIEELETGGLHISLSGIMLLFVGVTLSTSSSELSLIVFRPLNHWLFN